MKAKKGFKRLTLGTVGVLAAVAAGSAVAGIANTRHNLSSSGGANNNRFDGTNEVCVFCHTPHGTDTTAPVPLWNRNLSGLGGYQTYDQLGTSTLDGEVVSVGSVSIACLSCHDGTQAMDSVINGAGSGNWNPNGARMTGTWTQGNQTTVNTTTGKLGANGGVALIGTDLRNDHPVGIQYAGGGIDANTPTPATSAYGDGDFVQPSFTTVNAEPFWYIEKSGNGKRDRADVILYTRSDFAGGVKQPSVECASCHDPHVEKFNANSVDFMRVDNNASALCTACHVK